MPIDALLCSMANTRHTAVHRNRISAKRIEQFLLDAESFATFSGDAARLESLTELRKDTQQAIEELERNKHVLSQKFAETRKRIADQRVELDRLENMAIADMVKEDGEYQEFAGKNLSWLLCPRKPLL
jgi:chromosome segregation ATPase